MKIKSIEILSDYKMFREGQKIYFSTTENENTSLQINFSILAGRNGSGKTTLMSLIPTLFHHIERYNGKIPANFELVYDFRSTTVTIRHFNNVVYVSVLNEFENYQLVPKRSPRTNDFSMINKDKNHIEYSQFHQYTPMSVVNSTFSLHGEYPISRPGNYIGHQIVVDQSITNMYGKNHWGMGSISRGVLLFLRLYFEQTDEIVEMLKLFDLKFTHNVEFKYEGSMSEWLNIDKNWLSNHDVEIQMEEAYINDIEFEKLGRNISLNNMSSGEKMLLLRTISILGFMEEECIVIIEEPELHLDQIWNSQLMSLFITLFNNYNSHIIIATHSYSIINSVNMENLIVLENGANKSLVKNTYLASFEELFNVLYGEKYKENRMEEKLMSSISSMGLNELKSIYNRLGDSVYKYLVFSEMSKRD